ncbi:Hypothetical_protein [Hexamita inflata]|uniref:Hypothetical_protein n=1 Tax=Hexamita inflata TaxID=28002 RepID=A0AA86UV84_9EUKA|nr:Hypothetical protein HINF_LOCUS60765 [Hexamita inflata]
MNVVLYTNVNIQKVSTDQSIINQQAIQQTTIGGIVSYQTQCIIQLQQIELTNCIMTTQSIARHALSAAIIAANNQGNMKPNIQLTDTQVKMQNIFILNTSISTSTLDFTYYTITSGIYASNRMVDMNLSMKQKLYK